ncbi:unnamed protein product [Caenorhabditis brenneri]
MTTNSYLPLVSLSQKIGAFAFLVSTFFGVLLVFLTLFGVRQIFGTYKYLMVLFSSLGVFLAALETILHLNLHFYNGGLVFFTLSTPFDLSKEVITFLLPSYPGVYCITICLLAVQFIYRYWALFNSPYLSTFRGWKSLSWIAYCLFFGGVWYLGGLIFMRIDPTTETYFKEEMLIRYNVSSKTTPMLTFLVFDPIDGSTRWRNVSYTVIITIVMGSQYGTMIYCGWKMYSKMEEKLENFIPAGAAVCFFSFYPAMDSIIVLLVVTEYRTTGKRIWSMVMRKTVKTKVYVDGSTTIANTTGQTSMATIMRAT